MTLRTMSTLLLAVAAGSLTLILPFAPPAAADVEPPGPGWVSLPLADYLALVERAEARERAAAEGSEEPVAQLVAQRTAVTLGDGVADLTTTFEVELTGEPTRPVPLPLTGHAGGAAIQPARGAALHRGEGEGGALALVAPEPGRYTVTVEGRQPLSGDRGISRLTLAATDAPVAVTEVDLPAELAWTAPGAVVAEEREDGERRHLRLALPRGRETVLEVRRRQAGAEEERLLARSVGVTLLEVLPDDLVRHDVVLYEVLRGELAAFDVALPPGLEVEVAGSDEGEVVPLVSEGRLRVQRRRRLSGVGYLVVTSRPALPADGTLPLAPVVPAVPVRARYLVTAASVAARVAPEPTAAWARVDREDLPAPLRGELAAFDAGAVWRAVDEAAAEGATPRRVAIHRLPPVDRAAGVVRSRRTTTLLTVDGSLLHREQLTVDAGRRALDLELPAGATLWSASVDGLPVRPVERGGRLTVPLTFKVQGESTVELVAVEEAAIPPGRSRIRIELPRVGPRVLEHRWRLLLPEANRYRFAGGDLTPAPLPGSRAAAPTTVTSEAPLWGEDRAKRREEEPGKGQPEAEYYDLDAVEEMKNESLEQLRQGLVGGVKPLAVTIPESGKLLFLAGALPTDQVTVELDVKARR